MLKYAELPCEISYLFSNFPIQLIVIEFTFVENDDGFQKCPLNLLDKRWKVKGTIIKILPLLFYSSFSLQNDLFLLPKITKLVYSW